MKTRSLLRDVWTGVLALALLVGGAIALLYLLAMAVWGVLVN